MFPLIDGKKKDKLIFKFIINLICFVISITIFNIAYNFYFKVAYGLNIKLEILLPFLLVLSISYICYAVISIVFAFYRLSKKTIQFLVKSQVSKNCTKLKNALDSITALIATSAAFVASVIGLIISLKKYF